MLDNSQGTLALGLNVLIEAGGGNSSGGNGGTITITNLGAGGSNGGMSFADGVYVEADNNAGSGNAGTVTINAGGSTPGVVALPGTFSNGVGFSTSGYASGNGGTVTITASGITGLSSQELYLDADGGSNGGNGGTINVTTLSGTSTGDITIGVDNSNGIGLEFDASVYAPTGNGGTLNISSGNNLTVPANADLYVGPYSGTQGVQNGNGGNINLTASTASKSGTLTYNLGLTGNYGAIGTAGQGTGNGGTVTLTNNSSGSIVVGGQIDVEWWRHIWQWWDYFYYQPGS